MIVNYKSRKPKSIQKRWPTADFVVALDQIQTSQEIKMPFVHSYYIREKLSGGLWTKRKFIPANKPPYANTHATYMQYIRAKQAVSQIWKNNRHVRKHNKEFVGCPFEIVTWNELYNDWIIHPISDTWFDCLAQLQRLLVSNYAPADYLLKLLIDDRIMDRPWKYICVHETNNFFRNADYYWREIFSTIGVTEYQIIKNYQYQKTILLLINDEDLMMTQIACNAELEVTTL